MKVVRTAVAVVGAVATIASFIPGPWQPYAVIIAEVATVVSAGLAIAAKKSGTVHGSPTEYRLDPQAGIPCMLGRTFYAGNGVKRESWGTDNQYQGFTTVYSLGPINQVLQFTADRANIAFDGAGAAIGALAGWMWFKSQRGLCPEPAALPSPVAGYPGWGAASKLSGLCASNWVIKFDKKGKKYSSGPPTPGIVAEGVLIYDPRQDSTQPGGDGPCRALDEGTYVYSERPSLHALTFALGRYQNGKRRFGIGFKPEQIDMAAFIQGANIEDANDWRIGGVIYSTDDKWNTLKQMLEAGAAEPLQLGGKLSILQSAPKVSIATITSNDVIGKGSAVGTTSFRDRINAGIPRYRSEPHGWQVISADVVRVPEYVIIDRGERTKEFDWQLVQVLKQSTQLTAYAIVNAREFGPVELNLKLRWIGLKPGDCVTINVPELNLNNQKCIVISRSLNPINGAVVLQFKSETDAKHPFALGLVGSAPPVPSLTADVDAVPTAPPPGSWTMEAASLSSDVGTTPILRFDGSVTSLVAEAVIIEWRQVGAGAWSGGSLDGVETTRRDVSALVPGADYEGRVRYVVRGVIGDPLMLGPVTVGLIEAGSLLGGGDLAYADFVDFSTGQVINRLADYVDETGGRKWASQTGADVTSLQQTVIYGPPDLQINADVDGVILAGQLPKSLPLPIVTRGGASIRGLNVTSYALANVSPSLGTLTVDNVNGSATKGQVTLGADMTGSGSFDLVITIDGVVQPPWRVVVIKKSASPSTTSGSGGGSGAGNTFISDVVTSTSYAQVGEIMTVTKGTGQTISGSFSDTYTIAGANKFGHINEKWQYSPTGAGTWTDMGSPVSGTDATTDAEFGSTPGDITCNQSASPANGVYDVRLVAAKSGTALAITFDGSYAYVNVS